MLSKNELLYDLMCLVGTVRLVCLDGLEESTNSYLWLPTLV